MTNAHPARPQNRQQGAEDGPAPISESPGVSKMGRGDSKSPQTTPQEG